MSTSAQSLLIVALVSYLFGSIPFGYILVRIFRGEDVRQSGSGNIGATNVARKSPVLGGLTLLLDGLKGAAAVMLAAGLTTPMDGDHDLSALAFAALLAVVGHMFPIWLKFRGGKGVATALGSFLLVAPKAAFAAAIVFILVVAVTRYVSLGSILAVAVFPVAAWRFHQFGLSGTPLVYMSIASLLIIAKHHHNLARLLAGTESRLGQKHTASEGDHKA